MAQTEKDRLMAKRTAARAARERADRETAPVTVSGPVGSTTDLPDYEQIAASANAHVKATTATLARPVQNQASAALALPMIDKSREITSRDVIIPRLMIAQSMSKVVQEGIVPLGHWYHNSRNRDLGTSVTAILVDCQKTRSLYVTGAGVMCRSFDLVQGEGNPGILCEGTVQEQSTLATKDRGCSMRLGWTDAHKTPTNPSGAPLCGENYNFTVIILEDPEDPDTKIMRAIMTLRKTGIPAAKKLITMKVEEDYEWTDMAVRIKLVSKTNTRGTFQVPEAEWFSEASDFPKAQERAIRMARSVNPTMLRATLEATSEMD
jgi:hypothetical protein